MLPRKIPNYVKILAIPIILSFLIALIDTKLYKFTPLPRSVMIRSQLFLVFYIAFSVGIYISYKSLKFIFSKIFPIWLTNVFLVFYSIVFTLGYISFPLGLLLANYKSVLLCKISYLCLGHLVIISAFFGGEVLVINRVFKSRKFPLSLSLYLIAVLLTVDGFIRASSGHNINSIHLKINNFPRGFDGFRLVHISDIHIGPVIGVDEVREVVKLVNGLSPHLVVISGDLTDLSVARGGLAMEPLGELKAKYGIYFATGNHDYYILDMSNLIAKLKSLHVVPLLNERVKIVSHTDSNEWFYLAGIEDISTRSLEEKNHLIDIHAALGGRDKGRATLLIAHQPNAMREAIEWGVELVLGGHTHGGQFFPIDVVIYLFNPFFAGLYNPLPGTYVYVNPGTYFYMVPIKHLFRKEIALFHLSFV